ncbi:MAG: hypothetical protein LVQ64_05760, partial [Thermoplasmatales archaeon]|nr:hypothetical protein [Thermoplasmatales archaeon]
RLLRAIRSGAVRAVHDVSDGGLAVCLAEMAFGGGLGFDVDLETLGLATAARALAAEGGSRWIVEVRPDEIARLAALFRSRSWIRLGSVTSGSARLAWGSETRASLDLSSLYARWREGPGSPAAK